MITNSTVNLLSYKLVTPVTILPPFPTARSGPCFHIHSLPHDSSHPLDSVILQNDCALIIQYCQLPPSTALMRSNNDPSIQHNVIHLLELVTHGTTPIDETMCLYLYFLCESTSYT
jgi:hypothetical protein